MLLIRFTEEANLTGDVLLIDTGFARYLPVAMFEQASSITVETEEKFMKFVQSTTKKKSQEYNLHCQQVWVNT